MNINKQDVRIFFRYVLPSIFSFALSGIYSIVDGYFIGNRLGDAGLSAVTIVYPIVAFIQAVGTGLGMGGAIYFSIERARGQDKEANRLIAIANWLMLGQGLTMLFALAYLFRKGRFTMKIHLDQVLPATSSVVRVGLAPFGLAMSPNISLMIINRFSASYGGESAIAVYACIAYMISINLADFTGHR